MPLTRLRLKHFRCFSAAELQLDTERSIIYGANASGKTSLLEAVFYLAQGRSFRTANAQGLIQTNHDSFLVTGQLTTAGRSVTIGIERTQQEQRQKLAGQTVKSRSALAEALPVQLIDAEIHRLLAEGPRYRRRFLDWGAFHVEHGFLDNWRHYQRALRQRNEALRRHATPRERNTWDQELGQAGERLSAQREQYLNRVKDLVADLAQQILLLDTVTLQYRPGWAAGTDLLSALQAGTARDLQQGKTYSGPHRAELLVRVNGVNAQECLSRGQHKVLAACLILAQGRVLAQATSQQPTLLLDDLAAELDAAHLDRFLAALNDQPGQKLFTAITPDSLPLNASGGRKVDKSEMFHVERGQVRKQ